MVFLNDILTYYDVLICFTPNVRRQVFLVSHQDYEICTHYESIALNYFSIVNTALCMK